jgi:hypothetical protein
MVGVDPRLAPQRHVEGRRRRREHVRSLVALEDLPRHLTSRAVRTRPRDLARPALGVAPRVLERREGLAVEAALAHVRDLILDAALVLRRAHPRRVDEDLASLRVVEERGHDRRRERVGLCDDRRHVVGHQHARHRAEEAPRGVEALADGLGGLQEGRPHEHVAAHHEGHHERLEAPGAALDDVDDRAHQAEVDLRLLARLAVGDEHRGPPLAPLELLHREASERVVAGGEGVVAHQQRVDPAQLQGPLLRETGLDARPMRGDLTPLLAGVRGRPRLHAPGDVVHDLVGERGASRDARLDGGGRVPRDGLAVDPRLSGDAPQPLLVEQASENLSNIDHDQLPVGHVPPRDGDPRHRHVEAHLSGRSARRTGPLRLRKASRSWCHDPAKIRSCLPAGGPMTLRHGVVP